MKATLLSITTAIALAVGIGSLPLDAQPTPCPSFTPIVLGNQTNLAFVDINRNGQIDSNDCVVTGVGNQTSSGPTAVQGQMCFSAVQGGAPFLPGCNGDYGGTAYVDPTNGMGMALEDMGSVTIAFGRDSSASPAHSAASVGSAGQAISGLPVTIGFGEVLDGGTSIGEGSLCNDGGPAIMGEVRGVTGIARFERKTVGGAPYLCSNLPFPTTSDGLEMFPLCVSAGVDGDAIPGGLQGGLTYALFPLTGLPGCGGQGAPSANEWGLLGLATVLLALGTWTLRRLPRFGASLPRV